MWQYTAAWLCCPVLCGIQDSLILNWPNLTVKAGLKDYKGAQGTSNRNQSEPETKWTTQSKCWHRIFHMESSFHCCSLSWHWKWHNEHCIVAIVYTFWFTIGMRWLSKNQVKKQRGEDEITITHSNSVSAIISLWAYYIPILWCAVTTDHFMQTSTTGQFT